MLEKKRKRVIKYNPASVEWRKGKGRGVTFLRSLLDTEQAECVTWPLFRDPNGYGRVGYLGRHLWAHRLACELAHGPQPSSQHEAAHTCGKGHEGCVNPKHLEWKTRAENQADRYVHRRKPTREKRYLLTEQDVAEIRRLGGAAKTKDLAARFGVSTGNIRLILLGETWKDGKRAKGGFAVTPYRGGRPRQETQAQ
jgi:hypothetical protein